MVTPSTNITHPQLESFSPLSRVIGGARQASLLSSMYLGASMVQRTDLFNDLWESDDNTSKAIALSIGAIGAGAGLLADSVAIKALDKVLGHVAPELNEEVNAVPSKHSSSRLASTAMSCYYVTAMSEGVGNAWLVAGIGTALESVIAATATHTIPEKLTVFDTHVLESNMDKGAKRASFTDDLNKQRKERTHLECRL